MSPRTPIEPWKTPMEKWGMRSYRALAEKAGVGTSTVTGLVYGDRRSDEETMEAVAEALRLPVTTIREWAAAALGEVGPFELPAEANRLTKRERDAVLAVVRAMLDPTGQVESSPGSGKTEQAVGRLVDLARRPGPDMSRVAARQGPSEGRRKRDEQDDDAEH